MIAERELGVAVAESLRRRLADLRAATSVSDLIASPPLPLTDPLQMAIELSDGYRLVLAANHVSVPMLGSGLVDWSAVTRIKLLRMERS
jgi:hypothetical protein